MPINTNSVTVTGSIEDLGIFTIATVGALQVTPYVVGMPNGQGGYTVINSSLPATLPAIVTQKGLAVSSITYIPILLPPNYEIVNTEDVAIRWHHSIEVLEAFENIEPSFLGSSTLVPRIRFRPIDYIEIESNTLSLPYPGQLLQTITNPSIGQIAWDAALGATIQPIKTVLSQRVFARKKINTQVATKDVRHPNYRDLVGGYELDNRTVPDNPVIITTQTKTIKIKYYRENKLEPIPNLKSICWMVYECDLVQDVPFVLPIVDCVLGTLYCDDADSLSQISLLPNVSGKYNWSDLSPSAIPSLFAAWNVLWDNENSNPNNLPIFPQTIKLHKLAANNDVWNNGNLSGNLDINFETNHPMFRVDDNRAYDWHVAPQIEGIGTLTMDSIRTIENHFWTEQIRKALQAQNYLVESGTTEPTDPHYLDWHIKNEQGKVTDIWNALEAGKYGTDNETDPNNPVPRKWNLGTMLENVARVLGLRRTAQGKIDRNLERKLYLPATLNNPTLKGDKYSTNAFGDLGLMIPHLPTAYTKRGGATELWDVVSDLPQLIQAVLRQLDVSLGIQHGSEIRTRSTTTGKIVCYPNQLSMLLEMERKISVIEAHTNKTYITTLVTSNEVRALFSGIGIPVTQRFIPLVGQGKTLSLPYFSHQKNQPSIANRLNGLEVNIGIINGVLMPKAQSPKNSVFNPFSLFTGKSQS